VQSDREFKAEWIKKRRRRKKDSHSVKVLQATKFKHVEKIKNVEQEYRKKSKDIIVLLVDAKLDYHWTNGIPIRTQGENNSPFFSNSKILVILHQTTLIIQTFMMIFIVNCVKNDHGQYVFLLRRTRKYSYV